MTWTVSSGTRSTSSRSLQPPAALGPCQTPGCSPGRGTHPWGGMSALQVLPATLSPSPHSPGVLVCLLPVSRVPPGTSCPSLDLSQPKMGLGGHQSIRPLWQVTLEKCCCCCSVSVCPWAQGGLGRAPCQQPRGPPSTWVWVCLQCLSRVGGRGGAWGQHGGGSGRSGPTCVSSRRGGHSGPPSLPPRCHTPRGDLLGRDSH